MYNVDCCRYESGNHTRIILIMLVVVGTKAGGELRHYIDVTELHVPRPGMEVQTYMKDGQVDNWDLFEKMLDYCYAKVTTYIIKQIKIAFISRNYNAGIYIYTVSLKYSKLVL
jgi:hypothetical protein